MRVKDFQGRQTRFAWPRLHQWERASVSSALVSTVLTGIGAGALAASVARLTGIELDARPFVGASEREVVLYTTPVVPSPRSSTTRRNRRPRTSATRAAPSTVTTAIVAPSTVTIVDTTALPELLPAVSPTDSGADAPSRAVNPIAVRRPLISLSTSLDAAGRDSVWAEVRKALPLLALSRIRAQPEKDSLLRSEALRQMTWRGGPLPISGIWSSLDVATIGSGGGGISAPLFARGPSRAQRVRDSVIHADNLQRLARLAARARAGVRP